MPMSSETPLPVMPRPAAGELRLVALGGLGEIGMNCLAIEDARGMLVVDCGISFPDDDVGVDVYHPDFSWLQKHRDRIAGVVLTHGHEDHVGGVPYLLERLNVPVFGPPHALCVARHRVEEHALALDRVRFVRTTPGRPFEVGPFVVEPIRVTHSAPDATALAIRTDAGLVVHTGDFKIDPTPPDGQTTDESRLMALGAEHPLLLMSDSTNVDALSEPGSEADVARTLDALVRSAKQRVVVGMFASNLLRLQSLGEIAKRAGRRIALFGRSLELSVQWGHELGRLAWPANHLVAREQAASVAPSELLVLAGGTQAEPTSSLVQLAARSHPSLKLEVGDTVILSSRIIPGNDRPVLEMMAGLLRQGVVVRSSVTDPGVHVSGHAHRSEQRRMIDWVRPDAFIPVHGTRHHLERHAELARQAGVANVLVAEDGDLVSLGTGRPPSIVGRTHAGRVATFAGIEIPAAVLRERHAVSRAGVLHVGIVLDAKGRLATEPLVTCRGVLDGEQDPSALRFIAIEIVKALGALKNAGDTAIADASRLAARRVVEARTGRKPITSATVRRLD
jgi:ribonuclease J